jgi:hypothetical protein
MKDLLDGLAAGRERVPLPEDVRELLDQRSGAVASVEEDVDLAASVADFRGVVLDIRRWSQEHFDLATRKAQSVRDLTALNDLQAQIDDALGHIEIRAQRLGVSVDRFLDAVNADLAANPPPTGQPWKPRGEYERHLLDRVNKAHADEQRLYSEIKRLEARIPELAAVRSEADRACAGYFAGWPLRGPKSRAGAGR